MLLCLNPSYYVKQIYLKRKMKKILFAALFAAFSLLTAQADDVMTKKADGTYVVNTTTLAKDVKGYLGTTPVEIHIQKNKIVKVVPLKNQETPKYFARIKKLLLTKWEGLKVSKAEKTQIDGVTGATMSSDAVKENVKRGLQYYQKHK